MRPVRWEAPRDEAAPSRGWSVEVWASRVSVSAGMTPAAGLRAGDATRATGVRHPEGVVAMTFAFEGSADLFAGLPREHDSRSRPEVPQAARGC